MLTRFTASPSTATGNASSKRTTAGAHSRIIASTTIHPAATAKRIALVNPASA